MLRDLNDLQAWLIRVLRRLDRLESGAILENSSITKGRMRFIGGVLRLDSGALFELIGSALISGALRVIGRIDIEGLGILTVNGLIDLLGNMRVRGGGTVNVEPGGAIVVGNVRIEDGKITVGAGSTQIVANGADGSVTTGNVKIKDGKITVGVGGNLIVMDGATGRIIAGSMTIDPALNGGSVKFAGGPEIYADGAQLSLYSGTGAFIELNASMAKINGPGARWIEVAAGGFRLVNLPKVAKSGIPVGCVYKGSDGFLYEG